MLLDLKLILSVDERRGSEVTGIVSGEDTVFWSGMLWISVRRTKEWTNPK